MALISWSTLVDGEVVDFNPLVDKLRFDDLAISAASVVLDLSTGITSVFSVGGKTVTVNTAPATLTSTNVTFADGSLLLVGDNTTGTANDGGNNTLTGSGFNDQLLGFGGNDTLIGGAGNDMLDGGTGNDKLNGGAGNDTQNGGDGNDVFLIGDAADHDVGEEIDGGAGTDVIRFTSTTPAETLILAAGVTAVESVVIGTAAGVTTGTTALNVDASNVATALTITGNAGANVLTGTSANDTLNGGAGDDTLDGGTGINIMRGGLGADTYVVNLATDVVSEALSAGTDTVVASLTYTLGANVENLTLTGSDNLNGTGNTLANVLTGNSGVNILTGGAGNDTYLVQNATDTVVENLNAGIDLVQSSVNFTLGANVEHLTLTGSAGLTGTGNGLNNILTGNSGINQLSGLAGNDTLEGGADDDTLTGGDGNDVFLIGDAADHDVGEEIDGGAGTDVLRFTSTTGGQTLTLAAGVTTVESVVIGTAAGVTTGTTALNVDASNVVTALTITGNAGANVLTGTSANDTLNGGAGDDTLDGGAGNNTLIGGTGNDSYIVDALTDGVSEGLAAGTDTVVASLNYTLGANVENLELTGSALNGTGNTLANILTGNSGNNTLSGLAGNDQLIGGAGQDTVTGGTENDRIVMQVTAGDVDIADGGAGSDTLALVGTVGGNGVMVVDLSSLTDQVTSIGGTPEALVQKNFEHLDASGLGSSVHATGSGGANLMIGSNGTDQLTGNGGNDVFLIGAAADHGGSEVINGGAGTDVIRFTSTTPAETLILAAGVTAVESVVIGTAAGITTGTTASNVDASNVVTALTITGNAGANVLTGTSANDTLNGGAGDDTLDGGAGNNTLIGGTGNDSYIVDALTDGVSEGLAAGTDTVVASLNYTLGANVENLELTGSALNGTGNTLANILTGNSGNNTLSGLAGNDQLIGGDGNDTLLGGDGRDTVQGGAGDDVVLLASAAQFATGELIDGGADTDTLRYTGTVAATLMLTAGVTNIEQVQIANVAGLTTGLAAINVNAAAVTNGLTLTGNNGNNVLTGTAFADTLIGNAGNDILIWDPADASLEGGAGTDRLRIDGGGMVVDLTVVPDNVITDIEVITLTGSGNNTLTLGPTDVLALSSTTDTLRVDGNAGDIVSTSDQEWLRLGNVTIGAQTYAQYSKSGALLQVDTDINRSTIGLFSPQVINLINLSSLNGNNGFKLSGVAAGDESGFSVSTAGDVNGDGFADLLIGARYADPNGTDSGASYVVFGKASGFGANLNLSTLDGTNGFQLSGVAAGDESGLMVSTAGDVNGDGFADLLIGACYADPHGSSSGASYVVFGKASGFGANLNLSALDGTNGFQLSGEAAGDESGFSVSTAGDVNGDGFADLLISAHHADPHGSSSGASYVVFGKASGFGANLNLSALDGTNGFQLSGEAAGDESGYSVSTAGDVNGDGFADLLIGAHRADPNGTDSGASYVVFGKASGFGANLNLSALNGSNGFQISGEVAGDRFARGLSTAGDVNGDGFADLLINATHADPHGSNSGASYVVFGKASGFGANLNLSALNGSNGFQISGVVAGDESGFSVSTAGDVNGDGFADLLISATHADPHGSNSGASYVVFGKASGFGANLNLSALDGTNGFQLWGVAAGDESGFSVSTAGDVNGDGFADLLIGAHRADPHGSSSGASYLVFGFNMGKVDFPGTSGDDTLTGSSDANILIGGLGNDTLNGGVGNDRLAGGLGNDIYQINRGDGQDTISDNDSTLVNSDKLLYGASINPLDLVLSRQVNDLRIALHGTAESVTIDNWYANPTTAQVETIQAGNGQTLLSTQVDQLIQAMAGFTQQTGLSWDAASGGAGDPGQQAQFQGIIAENWQ